MDWEKERDCLVRTLSKLGITDKRVLSAMRRVPRHRFVLPPQENLAYGNFPLPIGQGQTISQPFMVAHMTGRLGVGPGDKVLEIGTGSGYQAAILVEMGCEVYSIERIPELAERARKILQELGYEVKIRVGDGNEGWPEEAPFRSIIVTAGASEAPEPLLNQLETGGKMIIPIGSSLLQYLTIITRTPEGFKREKDIPCCFVPFVGPYSY
ncbi:MAG: protein-L-isoaspartate(D-aspartate) O-methyltransferase [candidate division WOR-3 bacterium]